MILVYEQFVDSVSFIQSVIWRWMQLWMYDVNRKLKQQQRHQKRHFKINICEMVTILWLLAHPCILGQSMLQMDW